ncbi:glycosyltransferase family 1 protein [Daldinia caldariorum]|uniref:glycosyltransferase family 1 protein n=1 Tax=Daldinia caldariorum TaxID=326644 RepID=UPI0020072C95|nr:glycosyltransferase family 1 protein [Daldinia caldariorum]KAI1471465.1 glycosyltransferase family 1 protein [Daldinia caldariorum]
MASEATGNPPGVGGVSSTNTPTNPTNSLFNNNHKNLNPLHTPSPTVEEPPLPTFDGTASPSNTKTSSSLNKEHWQCIVNMEALHSDVLAAPVRGAFDFIRSIVRILAHVLSYGFTRAYCGAFAVLSMVSLKVVMVFLLVSIVTLVFFVIPRRHRTIVSHRKLPKKLWPRKESNETPFYVILVCGSGGHTAEMIKMVQRSIKSEGPNSHRRWAIGYGDEVSYKKVMDFERYLHARFNAYNLHAGTCDIGFFRRSRAVHQSWWTTVFSVVDSVSDAYDIILDRPLNNPAIPEGTLPGVVVTDGPGTGFVFMLCAYLMKLLAIVPVDSVKCVFVESWARVNSLSFSGKLVEFLQLSDVFIVQHPPLRERYPRQTYVSNMVVMPTIPSVPLE